MKLSSTTWRCSEVWTRIHTSRNSRDEASIQRWECSIQICTGMVTLSDLAMSKDASRAANNEALSTFSCRYITLYQKNSLEIPTCQCFQVLLAYSMTPLFLLLPMPATPLVFNFTGIVFSAILYGKHCTATFDSDEWKLYRRFLWYKWLQSLSIGPVL